MKFKFAAVALVISVTMCCSESSATDLLNRLLSRGGCGGCDTASTCCDTPAPSCGAKKRCGLSLNLNIGLPCRDKCGGGCGGGLMSSCGGGCDSGDGCQTGGRLLGRLGNIGCGNLFKCDRCGQGSDDCGCGTVAPAPACAPAPAPTCGPTCGDNDCGCGGRLGGLLGRLGKGGCGCLSGGCDTAPAPAANWDNYCPETDACDTGDSCGGGLLSRLGNCGSRGRLFSRLGNCGGGCDSGCDTPVAAPCDSGCGTAAPAPSYLPAPVPSTGCGCDSAPNCGCGNRLRNVTSALPRPLKNRGGCGCGAPSGTDCGCGAPVAEVSGGCGSCGDVSGGCGCGSASTSGGVGSRHMTSRGKLTLLDRLRGNRIPEASRYCNCGNGCNPTCPGQGCDNYSAQPVMAPVSDCGGCTSGASAYQAPMQNYQGGPITSAPMTNSVIAPEAQMTPSTIESPSATPVIESVPGTTEGNVVVPGDDKGALKTPVVDPRSFIIRDNS